MNPIKLINSPAYLIADVHRLLRQRFIAVRNPGDLAPSAAKALMFLARNEGGKQKELADALDVKPMTVARLVDQLVSAGLIERRQDTADRRAHLIYLTDAATPYLEHIGQLVQSVVDEALQDLDEKDVTQLTDTLSKIRGRLLSL